MFTTLMNKVTTYVYAETINTESEIEFWDDKDVIDISWYTKNPDAKIFKIYTAEELGGLSYLVNGFYEDAVSFEGCNIYLCNNIDLSGKYWSAIGDEYSTFKGNFNGQGFVINNMNCDMSQYSHARSDGAGLFGYVNNRDDDQNEQTSTICNLGILNGTAKGYEYVGMLAGITTRCYIYNCYVNGNTYGCENTGAFVGRTRITYVANCFANAQVSVNSDITTDYTCDMGGMFGVTSITKLENCYSKVMCPDMDSMFADGCEATIFTNCFIDDTNVAGLSNFGIGGYFCISGHPSGVACFQYDYPDESIASVLMNKLNVPLED